MNDESLLPTLIDYIKDNFLGLLLLAFVFLIIYCVDYINGLNAVILSTLNITSIQIPGIPNSGIPGPTPALNQFKTQSLSNKITKHKRHSKSKQRK